MTPADLIWILKHLPFPDKHPLPDKHPRAPQCLISLDKGVRVQFCCACIPALKSWRVTLATATQTTT